jgi:hypothetical protein
MVSLLERTISYCGIISIYTYGLYKFFHTKTSFNQKFHDSFVEQANKLVNYEKNNNFKFVDTKTKLLFLLGVDEETSSELIDRIIENFIPNYLILEKKVK